MTKSPPGNQADAVDKLLHGKDWLAEFDAFDASLLAALDSPLFGTQPSEPQPKSIKAPRDAGGRPSKFRAEYARQIGILRGLGATDETLADFFDVSVGTIANWQRRYGEFVAACNAATQKD